MSLSAVNYEWSNITFIYYLAIIVICPLVLKLYKEYYFTLYLCGKRIRIPVGMFLVGGILIFVKGFSTTGHDVRNGYYLDFLSANSLTTIRDRNIEVLYKIINVVIKNLFGQYWVLLLSVSLITIVPVLVIIWKYRNYIDISLAILCYLCLFYFNGFSAIRNYMAASISLLVFDALYEEKRKKSLILIIVAMLLHRTMIVLMVPFVCVFCKNIKKVYMAIGGISGICLIYIFRNSIINYFTQYDRYSVYASSGNVKFGIEQIVYYMPLFLLLYIGVKKYKNSKFDRLSFCYLVMGASFGMLSYVISIFGRFQTVMLPLVVILPYYMKNTGVGDKERKAVNTGIFAFYCIARFYIYISQYYIVEGLMPYTNIWGWHI